MNSKNNNFLSILLLCIAFVVNAEQIDTNMVDKVLQVESAKIYEIEFKDALLADVIRVLAEQSGTNIIATKEANKKRVTIYLKNISVKEAIESICRINELWYRQDGDGRTFRILTAEEYQKDLTFYKNEQVRVFKLLNPNVRIVAQAIEDLYGDRVELSLGLDPAQEQEFVAGGASGGSRNNSSGGSNSRNNNNNNRNSSSSRGSGGNNQSQDIVELDQDLTVSQIESLSRAAQAVARSTTAVARANTAVDELRTATTFSAENITSLTSQLSPVYVTVNNEHNLIIVRTSDLEILDSIASLIEQMDKPVPQVLLEMKVLDILIDDGFRSIANFGADVGQSNVEDPDNAGSFFPTSSFLLGNFPLEGGTFVYEFISDRVRAVLELLVEKNRINVLSKPVVLASNNRPAELFVGEETIITTGVNSETITNQIASSTFITAETEVRQVGNRITITPFINSDNSITLALDQETSSVNDNGASVIVQNGAGGVTSVPIDTVNTATLNGTVVAKHGYTMAVGGLIRDSKNKSTQKVPVLGDIPVLGSLFRREQQGDEHRELVLLITPYVMRKGEEYVDITRKRLIEPSQYSDWELEEVPPEFIKPRQKLPGTIENDLKIYEDSQLQPKNSNPYKRSNAQVDLVESAASNDALGISSYDVSNNPAIELINAAASTKKPEDAVRISVDQYIPAPLFLDRKLVAYPKFTWEKDGLYVTRVTVKNISSSDVKINPQNLRGDWLSASFDSESLKANSETDGYLISNANFEKSLESTPDARQVKQVVVQ
jgi:general secretion pathway protein D